MKYLLMFDWMNVIVLLFGDWICVCVVCDFDWLLGGLICCYFYVYVFDDFFGSCFDGLGEMMMFL